jgi:hypothetical protein
MQDLVLKVNIDKQAHFFLFILCPLTCVHLFVYFPAFVALKKINVSKRVLECKSSFMLLSLEAQLDRPQTNRNKIE